MDEAERKRLGRAMCALADGDRDAFAVVFRSVKPLLDRYVTKMVRDPASRDEIVQASVIKVFEAASTFDPDRDAAVWVIALASWEIRSFRRDRSRQLLRSGGDPASIGVAAAEDPERETLQREVIDAVHQCVGDLSPADQEVILATLAGERQPNPTFRKRLERALARFKSRWVARYEHDAS
ncbi:MAG: sigma-70 family RNA polymerase sigma factor [Polyangiaceae bacterium]|nr:sigma-70 family RNA polymerase sigma factor [Polyangiaceae bacterium]